MADAMSALRLRLAARGDDAIILLFSKNRESFENLTRLQFSNCARPFVAARHPSCHHGGLTSSATAPMQKKGVPVYFHIERGHWASAGDAPISEIANDAREVKIVPMIQFSMRVGRPECMVWGSSSSKGLDV